MSRNKSIIDAATQTEYKEPGHAINHALYRAPDKLAKENA